MKEALVTINGVPLTEGQSMTLRCALEAFDADLAANGLGDDEDDETGRALCDSYRARIQEIRKALYR